MKQYYTIQIAPDGPGKVHTFRVSRTYMQLIVGAFILIFISGALFLYKLAEINAILLSSRFLKQANEKLLDKHKEYEQAFAELDSIYSMENQIQNILQTYLENDSDKVSSILDQNRFHHISSEKTRLHLDRIYEDEQDMATKIDYHPNIIPVVGVISKKFEESGEHKGTDFATASGEPVFATAYGNVIFAGTRGDLGLTIEIDHKNGIKTSYSHLGSIQVRKGDFIKKGETIGTVGMTGNTSGPHLHYRVEQDGKEVDPQAFFHD